MRKHIVPFCFTVARRARRGAVLNDSLNGCQSRGKALPAGKGVLLLRTGRIVAMCQSQAHSFSSLLCGVSLRKNNSANRIFIDFFENV